MEAAQTASLDARYPQDTPPPSFESVWAALQETDRIIKEVGKKQEETAQQMKETDRKMQETDRIIKEVGKKQEETTQQMKETDRQIKDFNKRFGDFTRRFGEVVEYMIAPNLCDKFTEFGFVFEKANSGTRVSDHKNDIHFEIDVMLENGDKAMLVEVKTKLTTEDVKDHIARLEKMRNYADLHNDKRAFLGAVAGVVMTADVKRYALGQGFYVIEPSGETFNITPPNGQPKEW